MHIEYTTLTDANTKYIVDFEYSVVSSTPKFRLRVLEYDGSKAEWSEKKEFEHVSNGEAAINEIREVLNKCDEFTTLHDKRDAVDHHPAGGYSD